MKLRQLLKIPPGYYRDLAMAESSGGKHQRAFKINDKGEKEFVGTASGDFQFVEGTWKGVVKRMGKDWILDDRFDSEKSRAAVEFFTRENEDYLKNKIGREPNKTELYAAHHFGNYGASKFLKRVRENPNEDSSSVFSSEVLKANPHLQGKTVIEAYNELARRIKGKQLEATVPEEKVFVEKKYNRYRDEYPVQEIDNTAVKIPRIDSPLVTNGEEGSTGQEELTENEYVSAFQPQVSDKQIEYAPQAQENLSHLYNYIDINNYKYGGEKL